MTTLYSARWLPRCRFPGQSGSECICRALQLARLFISGGYCVPLVSVSRRFKTAYSLNPGGVLSEKMNRQTTHLISAVSDSPKARKAPEWGIQLVKQSWLLTTGKTGTIEPEDEHRFEGHRPATAVAHNRRLDVANGSMANMSVVLDIGDPTYERGKVAPPSSNSNEFLPPTSQRSAPLSPSRMLKLTPTHVDDKDGAGRLGGGERSHAESPAADPSNILSPPKRETTRLLNQAEKDGKVGRTISAPPNAESLKKHEGSAPLNPLRGSSTG